MGGRAAWAWRQGRCELPALRGRNLETVDPLEWLARLADHIPVNNGEVREIPGFPARADPIQWSADGRAIYFRSPERTPGRVWRLKLSSGRKAPGRS